jgi:hypothetical protein
MRKVFAGALIFSIIGAVVLGGTLAWQNSKTVASNAQVSVGALNWSSVYEQASDALLGPDGSVTTVGHGSILNAGDFNLALLGGSVIIKNVDTGHASCDPANFTGAVQSLIEGDVIPEPPAPGSAVDDAYRVVITVKQGAPASCIGATITYDVKVTVGTTPNAVP